MRVSSSSHRQLINSILYSNIDFGEQNEHTHNFGVPIFALKSKKIQRQKELDFADSFIEHYSIRPHSLADPYQDSDMFIGTHIGYEYSEDDSFQIPAVLKYMCDYIIKHGTHIPNLFRKSYDLEKLESLKQEFDAGHFYDCGSVVAVGKLLKIFLRELPEPIIPHTAYQSAIIIVSNHIYECTKELLKDRNFSKAANGQRGEELWDYIWKANSDEDDEQQKVVKQLLSSTIEQYAFSLSQEKIYSSISEWVYTLPDVNKDCLEYIGIFFIKFALESGSEGLLDYLCQEFYSYLLKPILKEDNNDGIRRESILRYKFMYIFLLYLKRERSYLSKIDEEEMYKNTENLKQELLGKLYLQITNRINISEDNAKKLKYIPYIEIDLDDYNQYTCILPRANPEVSPELNYNSEFNYESSTLNFNNFSDDTYESSDDTIPLEEGKQNIVRHFLCEWGLEPGQFIDKNGNIGSKKSDFLSYSPYCRNWLKESYMLIHPVFRPDDDSQNHFSEITCHNQDKYLMYDYNDMEPPGKGILQETGYSTRNFSRSTSYNTNDSGSLLSYFIDQIPGQFQVNPPIFKKGLSCYKCGKAFNMISRKKHCNYCGNVFCATCSSFKYLIPYKIILQGNFDTHTVCKRCFGHLSSNSDQPRIPMNDITQSTLARLGERMRSILQFRKSLTDIIYEIILPDCPTAPFLLGLIPPDIRDFLASDGLVSIANLIKMKKSSMLEPLKFLDRIWKQHIFTCNYCKHKLLEVKN
eukprot:TRINITY_DN7968_c0_g1_i1.p1 TRINITY_DN7968_c0_g1~~TRINITY_DN7968_c0_g1_i1.p1  ORF type:complete len:751 (+),score=128.51 TRINITY_DN7968_c0_g1_i1:81-2333(+)